MIMKRLFLTVVALLSMTMTFAGTESFNNVNNASAYNMSVNYAKLADCLKLSSDQVDLVRDIHTSFCNDMTVAAYAKNNERQEMVKTAVVKDLRYMRSVLDAGQYRKYLMLLNLTFNNRKIGK